MASTLPKLPPPLINGGRQTPVVNFQTVTLSAASASSYRGSISCSFSLRIYITVYSFPNIFFFVIRLHNWLEYQLLVEDWVIYLIMLLVRMLFWMYPIKFFGEWLCSLKMGEVMLLDTIVDIYFPVDYSVALDYTFVYYI